MKSKLAALMIALSLSTSAAWSAEQKIKVAVKGMVCGFCAQGITKKLTAESSVKDVDVNLGAKQVKVTLKDGASLSDDKITELLTESGYTVDKIERE